MSITVVVRPWLDSPPPQPGPGSTTPERDAVQLDPHPDVVGHIPPGGIYLPRVQPSFRPVRTASMAGDRPKGAGLATVDSVGGSRDRGRLGPYGNHRGRGDLRRCDPPAHAVPDRHASGAARVRQWQSRGGGRGSSLRARRGDPPVAGDRRRSVWDGQVRLDDLVGGSPVGQRNARVLHEQRASRAAHEAGRRTPPLAARPSRGHVSIARVPSAVVCVLAGWARMRLVTFLALNFAGAVVTTTAVAAIGFTLGQTAIDIVLLVDGTRVGQPVPDRPAFADPIAPPRLVPLGRTSTPSSVGAFASPGYGRRPAPPACGVWALVELVSQARAHSPEVRPQTVRRGPCRPGQVASSTPDRGRHTPSP